MFQKRDFLLFSSALFTICVLSIVSIPYWQQLNAESPGKENRAVNQYPLPRIHVVQEGETLPQISKIYYGTSQHWKEILNANRDDIPDQNHLRPGTQLLIPQSNQ